MAREATMKIRRGHNMRSRKLVLLISVVLPLALRSQEQPQVPKEYKHFFFQYQDRRTLFEKALNSIGLSALAVPHSIALVAGVTRYPNFGPLDRELKPAAVDLEALKHYLKDQEFFDEVVLLQDGDMTQDNLTYFLEHYFPTRMRQFPHSRFLFAYSGHGYADSRSKSAQGFLLKSSAMNGEDTVNAVPLSVLRVLIDATTSVSDQSLVLINACHSGAFLGRTGFAPPRFELGAKGAHVILASRAAERSFHLDSVGPGSVFFEKIFTALGGAADNSPADGVVTYLELYSFLRGEIPLVTSGTQTPMEADIGREPSEGQFFFLNRSRQVKLGNVPVWSPKNATAFGEQAEDILERGQDARKNHQYGEAKLLFERAAAAGNPGAMNALGWMYGQGEGVQHNFKLALQWFEKGAAAGNPDAMCNLGYGFETGRGVPQNAELARQWYEKCAVAGEPTGMLNLGLMYLKGRGVSKDVRLARLWFEKGAAAGDADAMYKLGNMYDLEEAPGVTQDYQFARQWYEKAAAAGSAQAMTSLGIMYALGHGVSNDDRVARRWFEKAIAAGDDFAKELLTQLPH